MAEARILAVDDQLYFRVFLEDLLRQEGYDVATADGGEEALDLLGRERFDVVLTDLVMPGMDGHELLRRVRAAGGETDVVVVTGVGDVQSAIDAMKEGATDYLLKPLDRSVLLRTLAGLLQRRRMREEHARLMAENLEFMGTFSLHERALGLFSTLRPEPLADRVVEGLCLETQTQGGILWMARSGDERSLRVLGLRGLVRAREETPELDAEALPPPLAERLEGSGTVARLAPAGLPAEGAEAGDVEGPRALFVALRARGRLLGVARLSDPVGGGAFSAAEREAAERFAGFAAQAVANALEFRALERRSFREPATGAYTRVYFEDAVANEVEKARRFGRTFSLLRLELDGGGALRARLAEAERERWLADAAAEVTRSLRATDLLAVESEARLCLLLPETDGLGAAVLKRRVRAALEEAEGLRGPGAQSGPEVLAAAATFPGDGGDVAALSARLDERLEEHRESALRSLDLEEAPFRDAAAALLSGAKPGRAETTVQMARLCLEEVGRRPFERGLLFLAPGRHAEALREGLEGLRGLAPRTQVVVVGEPPEEAGPAGPVTWVPAERAGARSPFVVYYAGGASYALLRGEEAAGEDPAPALYHSSDPVLVEHLAFQLGRELGIPLGEDDASSAARSAP